LAISTQLSALRPTVPAGDGKGLTADPWKLKAVKRCTMTTQTQTRTRNITLTQALNEAMQEEMRRDERVFIMGEDIRSGVYGASAGLFKEFGPERVRDCPLSENAFFGAAVGAAAVGMRPIVESAACFMWVGMDQLISQAAKMRYMFGGQVNLPIVYRTSMYYGGSMASR
jgi:pyruvate dehydrogenase E1 component beta subunit